MRASAGRASALAVPLGGVIVDADVKVEFELTDAQALALAQFVKRVRWTEVRQNAVGDDEADLMMDAMYEVAKALAAVGYAPR